MKLLFKHGLPIRLIFSEKNGTKIKLIEAPKSFDPKDIYLFVGKRDGLVSWKPYLFDISFQKYVINYVFPD
jgi:hypothetical protein